MRNRILAALSVLLFLASCAKAPDKNNAASGAVSDAGYIKRLSCLYFNENEFRPQTAQAVDYGLASLSAGVVPHHLLAGELIASFFKTAAATGKKYDTVVVIGPNHSGVGADISVSERGFDTAFGVLDCDKDLTSGILSCKTLCAKSDDSLLQQDHAVSGLIPFIKYYLPDVKVVPVLLTRRVTLRQAQDLAELVSSYAEGKNCLVVGSADFSHYLPARESSIKDAETEKAFSAFDYQAIKKMPNANLDSPETLCTILYYMSICGAKKPGILAHKSAAEYLDNPALNNNTTYFVLSCP
ncbi:MAG: AmmeMemoRadiSam system protein B [Bacillota bacterium]|nr:AmmeMemoRadiSam system protein B [Bacillota bacterium]